MKKLVLLSLILSSLLYAGTTHLQHVLSSTGAATLSITGTATVYSQITNADPYVTLKYIAKDAVDDSVALTITYQTPSVVSAGVQLWTDDASVTLTGESAAKWDVTSSTTSVTKFFRLKVVGGAANSKSTPVLLQVDAWGYQE